MKTVTVLMSTYNGEHYLDEQLDSIYHQEKLDDYTINLIIRDDGSSDNTLKIIESWKNKLNIQIIAGKNIGARDSFFYLLEHAPKSDYYAFCDQDDIWYKDKLYRSINKLKEKGLYFSNIEYIGTDGKPIGTRLLSNDFQVDLKRILMCNPANGCTMVWDQQLHNYVNKISNDTFTMHDEFMCTIACLFGELQYDSLPTMGYRLHDTNVTQSNNIIKRMKIRKNIWLGRKQYSLDKRAKELLRYDLRTGDREILLSISQYKKGLNRLKLIKLFSCEEAGISRSFKARMILGLL